MLAIHYRVPLPADYDMSVIRERVASRGHALDERRGLAYKAYLVRDVADGEPVNEYAPFYLWRDPEEAARFLWGGAGFGGIVADFGRPPVSTWIGDSIITGPRFTDVPGFASRVDEALPPDADPHKYAVHARSALEAQANEPGVHSAVLAIDPSRWRATRFALWAEPPSPGHGTVFRVLHLSTPELRELVLDAALPSTH
ncbi:DUF4865 family protein [Microbacteriaceae bacterium VKM Ac-2855]|nr:DUF4865 family protein [Microbacteriaceae bacterium VKM Ac-2855]